MKKLLFTLAILMATIVSFAQNNQKQEFAFLAMWLHALALGFLI